MSIAPFDVRQGNFIGAAINSVTRSGTNQFTASVYHRMRSEDFVGTEARGLTVNPGTFTFRDTGFWAGGPIVRNKLFAFGNYENEEDKRPLHTFRANNGGEPVGGKRHARARIRPQHAELVPVAEPPVRDRPVSEPQRPDAGQAVPAQVRFQPEQHQQDQLPLQPARFLVCEQSFDVVVGGHRPHARRRSGGLHFGSSNYTILENIKSGIGEWNTVIGSTMSNNLIVGLTSNDESRGAIDKLFPFVDILQGGTSYMSFGTEPFTVNNELRYKTFQLQDSFTKYGTQHTLTFGATTQRYESENVFWSCCPQSNYTYNSLDDFYTDANDFLRNPNRTTSPVTLRRFKVRYSNVPGSREADPAAAGLVQRRVCAGRVAAAPRPDGHGRHSDGRLGIQEHGLSRTTKADALTFRDQDGSPVQYQTGEMPDPKMLWSPRAAANWDVGGRGRTQVRMGTGLFTGPPLYVWISNQLGNTGVLIGEILVDNTNAFPFNSNPDRYKPANVTGAGAASFELNVTDPDFKFPQVWRTNFAVDQRLPGGLTGTVEFLYNKDVNGVYYINANLPAAQTTFSGADNAPALDGQPDQQHACRTSSRARSC